MIIKIKQKTLKQGILSVFLLIAIVSVLIGVSFTTNYASGASNITNMSIIAKVNVTNTQPNITNIWIDDSDQSPPNEIDLTSNGATVVTCNATVYDLNGFEDITGKNVSNATFYINSVGAYAANDNNSYYTNQSCNRCRQATAEEAFDGDISRTAICDCKFAVQYYANASNEWTCTFTVQDKGGTAISGTEINLTDIETNNSGVTVTELLAIYSDPILDFGNLSVTEQSNMIQHNITNAGNLPLNISIRGYGGIDEEIGTNLSMICSYGNITFNYERYSTSIDTPYADMRNLTNQSKFLNVPAPSAFDVNITWPQRLDDAKYGPDRNSTYWKIEVPLSVGGMCNGTRIFGAIDAR